MPFMNAAVLLQLIRKHPRCRKARVNGKEVWGIWDDEATVDELGIGIQTSDPQFRCRTVDVADLPINAEFVSGEDAFRIRHNLPDGQAMWSVLKLKLP